MDSADTVSFIGWWAIVLWSGCVFVATVTALNVLGIIVVVGHDLQHLRHRLFPRCGLSLVSGLVAGIVGLTDRD